MEKLTEREVQVRSLPEWDMYLLRYESENDILPEKLAKLSELLANNKDSHTLFELLVQFMTPSSKV